MKTAIPRKESTLATAVSCLFEEIDHVLNSTVASLSAIESVNVAHVDWETYVWVAISEDNSDVRSAVYAIEDALADRFPGLYIEFRVFQIPAGRSIEDFVSESRCVYKRHAA